MSKTVFGNKNMKKIILSLLLAAGITSSVSAGQPKNVQVVWPFAPGSTQAVMIRSLLENANTNQKNYQFIFVNKPGAGGSIAANSILNTDTLSVLVSSSSFYSRPLLYKESHNVDKFTLISQLCENAPIGVFSKKYKSLNELKNKEISIGINPGSITQIFTTQLSNSFKDITVVEIPYKDTVTAYADMLGKHIDMNVDLINNGTMSKLTSDVNLVAISGTQKILNLEPIKELSNLIVSYWFFASKDIDKNTQKELNQIFSTAIDKKIRGDCANEYGNINLLPYDKLEELHENNKKSWRNMTRGIVVQ
jgi:tripartite-type tricarboxylate transporter receptor subunit TctC